MLSIFKCVSFYNNLYANYMLLYLVLYIAAEDFPKPFYFCINSHQISGCRLGQKANFLQTILHYLLVPIHRICIYHRKCVHRLSTIAVYNMLSNVLAISFKHDWTGIYIFMEQHYVTLSEYFMNLHFNPHFRFDCFQSLFN